MWHHAIAACSQLSVVTLLTALPLSREAALPQAKGSSPQQATCEEDRALVQTKAGTVTQECVGSGCNAIFLGDDHNLFEAPVPGLNFWGGGGHVGLQFLNGSAPSETKRSSDESLCGRDLFALPELCPASCPFAAQVLGKSCQFRCVPAMECGSAGTNGNATIPDTELHMCRTCGVVGCASCIVGLDGRHQEKCDECMSGYSPSWVEHGKCMLDTQWTRIAFGLLIALAAVVVIAWYLHVASQPCINQASIDAALAVRSKAMVLQRGTGRETCEPYPLGTNLLNTKVAGIGTMCFFRFQCALLVWATCLLMVWLGLALIVSTDVLILGSHEAKSPQFLCAVVAWGHVRQMQLLWAKVVWLVFAYFFSFGGALAYALQQTMLFVRDDHQATMVSFAARILGLPRMKGSEHVEELLKQQVSHATREVVQGISVAWDYTNCSKQVERALEREMGFKTQASVHFEETEQSQPCLRDGINSEITRWLLSAWGVTGIRASTSQGSLSPASAGNASPDDASSNRGHFGSLTSNASSSSDASTKSGFCGSAVRFGSKSSGTPSLQLSGGRSVSTRSPRSMRRDEEMKQMLRQMENTAVAYVVFHTKLSRDRAVEAARQSGIVILGRNCELKAVEHEPAEVLWENHHASPSQRRTEILIGGLLVVGACLAWAGFLYLPFAHYVNSFSYANGDAPGCFAKFLFIVLVVCARMGLIACSKMAARRSSFLYASRVERTHVIFLSAALVLCVALVIVLEIRLSYQTLVVEGARSAEGQLIGTMTNFEKIIESFMMQQSLGQLLSGYCFPSTFFIPFVAELVLSQWLRQHLGRLLVGANPKVRGLNAMRVMGLSEMEQGRYADLLFNVLLVTCIPFLAPAYMHRIFLALIFSHSYIYCYDQVKVLRYVVRFDCSSPEVHDLAMRLLAVPTGLLLGAAVFKINQMTGGIHLSSGVLKGSGLLAAVILAVVAHIFMHRWALAALISRVRGGHVDAATAAAAMGAKHAKHGATYKDTAQLFRATYFSVNPVHCLRSRYLLDEKPHQSFYSPLKP